MIKERKILIALPFVLAAVLLSVMGFQASETQLLPTFFSYTAEELEPLKKLEIPTTEITKDDLKHWDEQLADCCKQNRTPTTDLAKIFAYFLIAQRDAAYLAHNTTEKFDGTLDPVSKEVLCIFFPKACSKLDAKKGDPFSDEIASIILDKVKERMHQEGAETFYEDKIGKQYWSSKKPYIGQNMRTTKPWVLKTADQFRAPPPPAFDDPEWDRQLAAVKHARDNITPEQEKIVLFWANESAVINWFKIANKYMWEHQVPLEKILLVQSTLAIGMADAAIAVFDSKYAYWAKRPFMRDPHLKPLVETPNHPSYPAGHSVSAMTCATILTYFFPQNRDFWMKTAHESSISRIWGGIHFPIDKEQGEILGTKVGEAVVRQLNQESLPDKIRMNTGD